MSNQGHLGAIALGLAHTYCNCRIQRDRVMDSDGEDQPDDLPTLIQLYRRNPDKVIVAQRAQRSEGCTFKLFYIIYKALFRILTGRSIDFGNYCLIGPDALQRLVYSTGTWNHIAATIMLSNLKLCKASTKRGQRYAGKTHMNTMGLIMHGLSAISVFSATAVTRILIGSLAGGTLMILFILVTLYLRIFTDLALPGWTSIVVLSFSIILFQLISVSSIAALQLMNNRSAASVAPIDILKSFIVDNPHSLIDKS